MHFGKYKCTYSEHEAHLKEAHLWEVKNLWDKVLDFNWHRQDKSPNWDVIGEEDESLKEVINLE